jgi:ethanolamine utilization microcompartment shell protein EutS
MLGWLLVACEGSPSSPASVSITVTASPSLIVEGRQVTLTATVTAPGSNLSRLGSTVQFLDGATALGTATLGASQQATLSTTLPAGENDITATLGGDTSPVLAVSVLASTTTTVHSARNPSDPTQGVTFTATVASLDVVGTPTGTVTFVVDNIDQTPVPLAGNTAMFSTSTLAAGAHEISAVYGGDKTFATSSAAALSQTVGSMAASHISLQTSGSPGAGQNLTFT